MTTSPSSSLSQRTNHNIPTPPLGKQDLAYGGVRRIRYTPRGGALQLMKCKDREILIEGPAGTGKSLVCLTKQHLLALKYPESRHIMLRKTRVSLRQSALVTWEKIVQPQLNGAKYNSEDSEYRYPKGSIVAVGGMDKGSKLYSSEWDTIYVQEATELTSDDIQDITVRARWGVVPYQQLLMDANPAQEKHHLNIRAMPGGPTTRILSRHQENPSLWDHERGCWTVKGEAYMERLDSLTGVRRLRLRDGIWCSAEGQVYEEFDPSVHIIDRYDGYHKLPCYWSVDFGYQNPFVAQLWQLTPDGTLVLTLEIYATHTLVEDHARRMAFLQLNFPEPSAVICDHDAEGRATLEKYLKVKTVPAFKGIRAGIQAVKSRMMVDSNRNTKIKFCRASVTEIDPFLSDPSQGKSLPTCTHEEVEGYIWSTANNRKLGEEPIDKDNHGMDAMRYMVAYIDDISNEREPQDYLITSSARGWMPNE